MYLIFFCLAFLYCSDVFERQDVSHLYQISLHSTPWFFMAKAWHDRREKWKATPWNTSESIYDIGEMDIGPLGLLSFLRRTQFLFRCLFLPGISQGGGKNEMSRARRWRKEFSSNLLLFLSVSFSEVDFEKLRPTFGTKKSQTMCWNVLDRLQHRFKKEQSSLF